MHKSHLPVKQSRNSHVIFREMEWDVAIAWQLLGLRGNYGIYVAVTGCTWQPSSERHMWPLNSHVDPVITTYIGPRNYHEVTTSHSILRKCPCAALTGRPYVKVWRRQKKKKYRWDQQL